MQQAWEAQNDAEAGEISIEIVGKSQNNKKFIDS